jgi:hypothetical protein
MNRSPQDSVISNASTQVSSRVRSRANLQSELDQLYHSQTCDSESAASSRVPYSGLGVAGNGLHGGDAAVLPGMLFV